MISATPVSGRLDGMPQAAGLAEGFDPLMLSMELRRAEVISEHHSQALLALTLTNSTPLPCMFAFNQVIDWHHEWPPLAHPGDFAVVGSDGTGTGTGTVGQHVRQSPASDPHFFLHGPTPCGTPVHGPGAVSTQAVGMSARPRATKLAIWPSCRSDMCARPDEGVLESRSGGRQPVPPASCYQLTGEGFVGATQGYTPACVGVAHGHGSATGVRHAQS